MEARQRPPVASLLAAPVRDNLRFICPGQSWRAESAAIVAVLQQNQGKTERAARMLGVHRNVIRKAADVVSIAFPGERTRMRGSHLSPKTGNRVPAATRQVGVTTRASVLAIVVFGFLAGFAAPAVAAVNMPVSAE